MEPGGAQRSPDLLMPRKACPGLCVMWGPEVRGEAWDMEAAACAEAKKGRLGVERAHLE